jgi:hypothetical protein
MQDDSRRIRSKGGDDGELTPGQAAALLNNERGVDKLREEVEELNETLQVFHAIHRSQLQLIITWYTQRAVMETCVGHLAA